MNPLKLKDNLYWIGVLDSELRVFDIIMQTEFGTTYNSYLMIGSEKTALFETVKLKFYNEYAAGLSGIVNIKDIDYLIVNHTEPDHAGSIGKILEINPEIVIVGTIGAVSFLKNIVNCEFKNIVVKENDILSLGGKTIKFLPVPNLHWPDTMFSYITEDNVLITCDPFGAHYAFDGILRSKLIDVEGYQRALKYYFENIIGPYKNPYMTNALNKIKNFKFDMILPGHGPVLDNHIDEIISQYENWCSNCNPNCKKTVVIPYVSAYGYTKSMAFSIADGIKSVGDIEVKLFDMAESSPDMVLNEITNADGILFGTPTILGQALKPVWELTLNMFPAVHGGKLASAFGNYGWSGEGVPHIIERLKQLKLTTLDGLRIKLKPSEKELSECYDFGYNFGCTLLKK
ncbi:MAG: FprA family A-type flavoprotein [Oscillospiraceae bacterium]|nr:FprA family A-type flavoprotein [Oscillospiraceae bacterium]